MGSSNQHTSYPPRFNKNSNQTQIIVGYTQAVGLDGGNLPAQQSLISQEDFLFCFKAKYNLCISTKRGSQELKQCNTEGVSLVSLVKISEKASQPGPWHCTDKDTPHPLISGLYLASRSVYNTVFLIHTSQELKISSSVSVSWMLLFSLLRGKWETTCKSLSLQESWKSKQGLALGVWGFCCLLDRPPQVALDFDKFRCIFLLFLYLLLLQLQLKRESHVKKKKYRKHIIEIQDKKLKVSITGHAKLFKLLPFFVSWKR